MYKVYYFEQLELITEEWLNRAIPFLPDERRQKALRYRQINDRRNCVVSWYLLKMALKECFQISKFTVKYGKYGKPYLSDCSNVYFSISHCKCGCVVAVADCPVGIDIQDVRPFSWEAANLVCTKKELEDLYQDDDRDRLFTRFWAANESIVKTEGISLPYFFDNREKYKDYNIVTVNRGNAVIAFCLG